MRQSRIYTKQALQIGQTLQLEDRASHYLANVLRITTGAPLVLFNGDGNDYLAEVVEVKKQKVWAR